MNLRWLLPLAVLVVLMVVGGAWWARSGGEDTPTDAPSASSPGVGPGARSGSEARSGAAASPRPPPNPPAIDTAVEAKQDPCTMLALARQKVRVNEDMIAVTDDAEAARQMEAVVALQNKAIARHTARIERRGLACPE